MSEKFTKGKWVLEGWLIVKDVKTRRLRTSIAMIDDNDTTSETERTANAALIAAAPDMYEALKGLIEEYEKCKGSVPTDLSDEINIFCRAALKLARGEARLV